MTKIFKMPTVSLTGRMSHSKPAIQILPTPSSVQKTIWESELDRIHALSQQSALSGKAYVVARQQSLRVGDLVEWAPTGKQGLWTVTDVSPYSDPADMNVEEAAASVYTSKYAVNQTNPCAELPLDPYERRGLLGRRCHDMPRGKVRLEWFSGWRGYEGNARPVIVKKSEVRKLNEMETLGLAAS
jgi:hypothetical protein